MDASTWGGTDTEMQGMPAERLCREGVGGAVRGGRGEGRRERHQDLGDQRTLPAPGGWGGGVQDAAVLGRGVSGENEDVGIKGQLSGVAAEAQGTRASSSWKPLASCLS